MSGILEKLSLYLTYPFVRYALIVVLFYNKIFAVTFDESFAQATGTNAKLYNLLIAVIVAVILRLRRDTNSVKRRCQQKRHGIAAHGGRGKGHGRCRACAHSARGDEAGRARAAAGAYRKRGRN